MAGFAVTTEAAKFPMFLMKSMLCASWVGSLTEWGVLAEIHLTLPSACLHQA
jgi:hypothetical protein